VAVSDEFFGASPKSSDEDAGILEITAAFLSQLAPVASSSAIDFRAG